MDYYEIYKSEDGWRIAIDSSPLFATKKEASEWRLKDIAKKIEAIKTQDAPKKIIDTCVAYMNALLKKAKQEA